MTIYCDVRECHHSHTVDLEAVRREVGEDVRKPRTWEHGCSTPEQALAIMRRMTG